MHCIFGALHLLCYVGTFGMLCNGIFGVLNRWCDATLVNYMLVAIFLWRTVSLVRCIFGVMYMHFWYAMHASLVVPRWCDYYCAMHLWCIVSWPWVQYIFGVVSLVLCIVIYIAQA